MAWQREVMWVPSLVTYLTLAAGVILVLVSLFRRHRRVCLLDKMPGPAPLTLIWHYFTNRGNSRDSFQLLATRSYVWSTRSSLFRMRHGATASVRIVKAAAAEVIFRSTTNLDKAPGYRFLHPWLGTGLLTSTGTKWHSRRKLLTPAFHFKILEDFVEVFNSQSNKLVNNLQKEAHGEPFDMFPYVTLCALDIICETAMGRTINVQDNGHSPYAMALKRMLTLVRRRMLRPWQHPNFMFKLLGLAKEQDACLKILHDFTNETIRERRLMKELDDKSARLDVDSAIGLKKRLAFLDLLLEYSSEGRMLSDEDIREEVDTFMFEGHDTTTAAINWAFYLLGCNPHIQARVHEELDGIFEGSERPATMDDIRQMKYTENCIKEALRLYPSVPYIGRHLEEPVVIDNYVIPEGTTIAVDTYRMHRDPEQFPSPELYDPDRFLPENVKSRHPYAYVPFSAGSRNCIGQKFAVLEEKVVVSSLLRRYRVESVTRREDLKVHGDLILRPQEGNILRLLQRPSPTGRLLEE